MAKKLFLSLALALLFNTLPEISSAQPKPKPRGKTALTGSKTSKPAPLSEKETLERALALTDLNAKIAALAKFVSAFPNSAEKTRAQEIIVSSRAQLADEKLRAGDAAGGVEFFRLAVREAPSPVSEKLFAGVLMQFPNNLFVRGQQAAALEIARLIEEKVAGDAKQTLGLATFYLSTENAAEAKRIAEKAISIDANLPAAYQILGLAHRMNFELEESANAYAKALEIDPNSAVSKRNLAEMRRALGRADEAEKLYREVLEKNAADATAQSGLVLSLFNAGKQAEAEAEMNKALEANPQNLSLLVGAAYWYASRGDGAKAIELGERAVTLEARYTWGHIALARGLVLQKRLLEAERTLLAARQYGNFPTLDYELASVRLAAGFYEEAARELRRTFAVTGGQIETKLAGRVSKQESDFIKLLELERRASIFEPAAADNPQNAEKLKSLLNFYQSVTAENADAEQINRAADEFAAGDDSAKAFRHIYAANKLLQDKKSLPKVLELTKGAVSGLDSALNAPSPATATLADELLESRTLAISSGQVVVVPDIPRQTLSAILRGRIEEINGWALYQEGKLPEAATRLRRALSVLPEKSAWWRSSQWRLGTVLDANGQTKEAVEAYIKSYTSGAPDPIRRAVIEAAYQKANGSLEGLDARIGAKPDAPATVDANQTVAQTTPEPAPAVTPVSEPTPAAETAPAVQATPEAKTEPSPEPSSEPAPSETSETKAAPTPETKIEPAPQVETKPSVETPKVEQTPEAKPETTPAPENKTPDERKPEETAAKSSNSLFEPVVITVPKTESLVPAENPASADKNQVAIDSGEARSRVVIEDNLAKPSDEGNQPCLTVSQENVSILSQGGTLGILVGFQAEGDLTQISAVSLSSDDVTVTPDDEIGKGSSRRFFIIKSISPKKGEFVITFEAPCGKKEIRVKVR